MVDVGYLKYNFNKNSLILSGKLRVRTVAKRHEIKDLFIDP